MSYIKFKIILCTVLRSIECIWLSEEQARTWLLDYYYFVVFVSFIVFMSIIFVVLFVCLFPVRCISFSLQATGFLINLS